MQTFRRQRATAGFTILELLIAVIIIGILVAIIVPVYTNRAEQARQVAAMSDLDSLKNAEEHSAIDTAYFYQLYVLDDVKGFDNIGPDNTGDRVDGIRDEALRGDAPSQNIFIDTKEGTPMNNFSSIFQQLQTRGETAFNWNGPYVNYSRKSKPGEFSDIPVGMPLDPWGRPYLFFTKKGYVDPKSGAIRVSGVTINGQTLPGDPTIFDRPTVLSLGLDGTSGSTGNTNFGAGDDLMRQF